MCAGTVPVRFSKGEVSDMLGSSWSKSTHSAYNGNCVEARFACVEVGYATSSHSHANNCVEAGTGSSCGMVHVRDTKDRTGGILSFSPHDWQEFVDSLKG